MYKLPQAQKHSLYVAAIYMIGKKNEAIWFYPVYLSFPNLSHSLFGFFFSI